MIKKITVKKILGWFTLLLMAWSLGWFSHQQWNPEADKLVRIIQPRPQQTNIQNESDSSIMVNEDDALQHQALDMMTRMLEQKDFSKALEYFETLQEKENDAIVQKARDLVFSHTRRLINAKHYRLAEQLLNLYLQNTFRDVEAHLLLAEINLHEKQFRSAINKLYEAKGYAYRAEMIEQIHRRIRRVVDNRTNSLQQNNNSVAVLELYQQLTQLEPDYAPYFLRLAAAQLALNNTNEARRSLYLIIQDPDVGSQAQALLNKVLLSEPEKEVAVKAIDIPLLRIGDHFLVDALLNNSQQVRLLIDTGASMTIITPDILNRSNISYLDTGKMKLFNTANGQVRAPIYEIESLTLGEWQVNQIEIGVMPLGDNTHFNGLLGMNFLKHFQFFIDQNEARLRLQGNVE